MDADSEWMKYLMEYLKGIRVKPSKWVYEEWEHDHCEQCSVKIDASTEIAYCTEECDLWLCAECYTNFKDAFGWVLLDAVEDRNDGNLVGRQTAEPKGGAWIDSKAKERWIPDIDHNDPIGPHWEFTDPERNTFRVFEGDRVWPVKYGGKRVRVQKTPTDKATKQRNARASKGHVLARKYHRESFNVEAMRVEVSNLDEVLTWINGNAVLPKALSLKNSDGAIDLMTTAGPISITHGDYILRTDEGPFLPINAPKFVEMFVPDDGGLHY